MRTILADICELVHCYLLSCPLNRRICVSIIGIYALCSTNSLPLSKVMINPVFLVGDSFFWGGLRGWFFLLNVLFVKTSKIPKFPDWVEQECRIEANDPYDFEQHPKPKLQSEPIKPFEYMIYTALLLISIVIFLGFIDLLSLAKGENSGLLKALFFWW